MVVVTGRGVAFVGVFDGVVVEVLAEQQLLLRKENTFSQKAGSLDLIYSSFSRCLRDSFCSSGTGSQVIGSAEKSNIAVTYIELDSVLDASSVVEVGEDIHEGEEGNVGVG